MVDLGAQATKGTILVDLDDTLTELVEAWVEWLDDKYELTVTKENITDWDICTFFPTLTKDQVFEPIRTKSFWEHIYPVSGAVFYLKKLYDEGYNIYIVTATDYRVFESKMENIIKKHFPFIDKNHVILADHKQLIFGDILIDDKLDNLLGGKYNKLLFRQPHNYSIKVEDYAIGEADGWEDCYNKIHKILP